MDSLLSNAQRCARKADSLVVYGLYDEALNELDKSIAYLNELKSSTTRYDNVQMLNVQIDSIDRKKRSVAIKRSESIKKKNRIDTILQNRKFNSIQATKSNNTNQYDNAPVLIEYCGIGIGVGAADLNGGYYSSDLADQQTIFVNGSKLDKDEKIIIEELSTTNAEFKKVNSFLVNEIEQLKKENDFLKVELIKLHMNDSLTSNESSICNDLNSTASSSTQNSSNNENSYSSSSTSSSGCESARSSPSVTNVAVNTATATQIKNNSVLQSKCSNINSDDVRKLNSYVEQFNNEYKTPNNTNKRVSTSSSSSSSSASSSSWSISSNSTSHSTNNNNNKTSQLIRNNLNNDNNNVIVESKSIKIDLSRYINDDDDYDDENDYDGSFVNNKNDTDDEFDLSNGLPPNEFTF